MTLQCYDVSVDFYIYSTSHEDDHQKDRLKKEIFGMYSDATVDFYVIFTIHLADFKCFNVCAQGCNNA